MQYTKTAYTICSHSAIELGRSIQIKRVFTQIAAKTSDEFKHALADHESLLLLLQTQVLSRMSAVCGVCREAKPFVPIEHANDANPTVWAVVPGHQICSDCALDLELDLRPCPFCRISHDKWRPVHNEIAPMDVDETYNGIPELFGSPRQASPPRPLSPTSERLTENRCQAVNAPPHRESLPASVRRRGPQPPSGCQFVYANPDTWCKLRGPRRTGSDGKVYCEAHIEEGPETAARLLQE
ncbi:hypothetical protein PROFUN_01707 [Planoprotostelium fungivorum]|uniref:Uncharacterized protein n=1 Tax=Planoprotostelium fungivorum TaxID=1890364 RepID=A0A2P6MW99_9EUKA|nr:hypothetical protein PROFUN_01707 [Planoprotostelium fungivorum]